LRASGPVVGVGAVIVDAARVVLVMRAHEPLKGEWSLPGGTVEFGETLEAAVAREVHEETGLTIDVGPVIEVFDRVGLAAGGGVDHHYVIVDYLCAVRGGQLEHGSDADDARWVGLDELDAYRLTEKAMKVIDKAIKMRMEPDRDIPS
jgi:8-oxo-dGTP diphosphatase